MDQDNVLSSRTVLLPVDVQEGFFQPDAPRLGAWDFEPKGLALLSAWRRNGWPILHIRHDSVEPASRLRPDRAGNSFRPGFAPHAGEPLIAKSVNSAFLGTDLDLRLKRLGADGVVVFGISTDICVSTTVRTGNNLGWRVLVAADACCTFEQNDMDGAVLTPASIHRYHLATLRNEFATVATVAKLLSGI